MELYPPRAVEWAMKVQEVILRAMSGQIKWFQAAEIIGVSPRTMRRWRRRYEEYGYDGLYDRRLKRPSPKRVLLATVEKVLRLYQEKYRDFNVAHFVEKLHFKEGIPLSYRWVKKALSGVGTGSEAAATGDAPATPTAAASEGDDVAPGREQTSLVAGFGIPRPDPEVRRCGQRGLLRATGGGREHEDGDGGDPGGGRSTRRVQFALHGRGESLRAHAGGGIPAGPGASYPGGAGVGAAGDRVDRGAFPPGAGSVRRDVRDLAGPAAAGVAVARDPHAERAEPVSAGGVDRVSQSTLPRA